MTGLFQQALCLISDCWEQDQESGTPWRTANAYIPTTEDRLVRYVKFLLWQTMDRIPAYRALALGCLLYSYAPQEVAAFTTEAWNSSNFRHIKGDLLQGACERFPIATYTLPPHQEAKIQGRPPNERELDMITALCRIFTAWRRGPEHSCPPLIHGKTTLRDLFKNVEAMIHTLEEDQKHALACPNCGGIPALVHDYNRHFQPRLLDPAGKLHIPLFMNTSDNSQPPPDGPFTSPDRLASPPLEPQDWTAIAAALAEQRLRRDAYSGGFLRVLVDGQEIQRFQTSQTTGVAFDIAADTAYIEVFGEDQHGEVLLAVFPHVTLDAGGKRRRRVDSVTHAGGQRITLQVSAVRQDDRTRQHLHIRYDEVPPPTMARLWAMLRQHAQYGSRQVLGTLERLWQRWGHKAFPNQMVPKVSYRQWSLALAALLLLSLGWNVWLSYRTFTRFSVGEKPVAHGSRSLESPDRNVLFNTSQFQKGIQSATDLGTLATAHVALGQPSRILGLAPPARRATFVRLGVYYANLLAYLYSEDMERATQHLDLLIQTFHTVPTPPVFIHYLSEMRPLLHSRQYPGKELSQFMGLFEPLYAEEYGKESGREALTLFRLGAWLMNVSLAAAAGDKIALQQGPVAVYLEAELARLNAPSTVLATLQRVRHLMTQPEIADRDIAEILELVKTLQRMFSA